MVFYHAAEIRAVSDFSRDEVSGGVGADRSAAGGLNCVTRSLFTASLCRPGLKCGAKEELKGGPVKVTVKGTTEGGGRACGGEPYLHCAFLGGDDAMTGRIRGGSRFTPLGLGRMRDALLCQHRD